MILGFRDQDSAARRRRKRYERSLRKATAQLQRARSRAPSHTYWIDSIDIALGLRRSAQKSRGRAPGWAWRS